MRARLSCVCRVRGGVREGVFVFLSPQLGAVHLARLRPFGSPARSRRFGCASRRVTLQTAPNGAAPPVPLRGTDWKTRMSEGHPGRRRPAAPPRRPFVGRRVHNPGAQRAHGGGAGPIKNKNLSSLPPCTERIKPIERLVPVSFTHCCASTPGLSTWWSSTALMGIPGFEGGFPLRCFQRLSRPDLATQRCHWRDNWYTRGPFTPVLSY